MNCSSSRFSIDQLFFLRYRLIYSLTLVPVLPQVSDDGSGLPVKQGQIPSTWLSVPITTTTVNQNHYSNEEDYHQGEAERRQHHQDNDDNNDDDDNDNDDNDDDDDDDNARPPSLHYAQLGGVFHRTVGRRVVTCLSESPPPPDYGLMASERDGRVVAGCAATASGGSGDLIMWRVKCVLEKLFLDTIKYLYE